MTPVRKNLRNIIILSIIVVICVIVITVSFKDSGIFKNARSVTLDVFEPVQEKTYLFFRPLSHFFVNIRDYFMLREKNETLQKSNAALMKDYSENINLKVENDSLRRLLEMQLREEHENIAAKVIGYYENKWQSEVTINEGSSSGIMEGMAVANDQGLIGVVIFTSNNTSQVRLLNDPQSSLGARLLSSRKLGTVEGSTNKSVYLNYIAKDEEVFKGDILVTSEFGENIPAEILIGRVKSVSVSDKYPYSQIEVEPFADYKTLEHVIVIKD